MLIGIFIHSFQVIHEFVEALDRYFGNVALFCTSIFGRFNFLQVCELDLIFNFHKAYYILDEVLLCGEQQETSKKIVLRVIAAQVRCYSFQI
jgi:AP-1 complex subunit sigma 1/2